MKTKIKNRALFLISAALILGAAFLFSRWVFAAEKPTIKAGSVRAADFSEWRWNKAGPFDLNYSTSSSLVIKPGESQRHYISSVYQTDFDFNGIGFKFRGKIPPGTTVSLYLRSFDKAWTEWIPIEIDHHQLNKSLSQWIFTEPIFVEPANYFQYRIVLKTKDQSISPRLYDLEIIYFDSTQESSSFGNHFLDFFFQKARAKDIELDVITRDEWRADESYRFNADDEEIWLPEYAPVKKFIIHHTAGSNGQANPKATVRGIYYWHAVVRGWGDIGYNYLIDLSGNIYEGRFGGDGVIGAHAYDEVNDINHNVGSIGIAILGNYETKDTLTKKTKAALTDLIAVKGRDLGIVPAGKSNFHGYKKLPNIIGHQDVDATFCPGKNIYKLLPQIRTVAQDKYEALPALPQEAIWAAELVGQSDKKVTLDANQEKEIWVDFKNKGNTTWRSYAANPLYIKVESESRLKADDWESDYIVTYLDTANVAPGETGTFVFTIKAPNDRLSYNQKFSLWRLDQKIANSDFSLSLKITGLEYAAELLNNNILPATFPETTYETTFTFKNLGLKTWNQDDLFLYITNAVGEKSDYYHASWSDDLGKFTLDQSKVVSQGTATIAVTLRSPSRVGEYREYFELRTAKGRVVPGSQFSVVTRVDSLWQAAVSKHTIPEAVLNVWKIPITLKFKNTGLTTWDRNVVLNIFDGDGRYSAFSDRSWPERLGNFQFEEWIVRPGETATFKLVLDAPAWPGSYYTVFKLEHRTRSDVVIQGELALPIRVDPYDDVLEKGYSGDIILIETRETALNVWKFPAVVKVKNTGTKTWRQNIALYIYDADLRESYFWNPTWPTYSGRILPNEAEVKPGEIATFEFIMKAPFKTGYYKNIFRVAPKYQEHQPFAEDSFITRVDPYELYY